MKMNQIKSVIQNINQHPLLIAFVCLFISASAINGQSITVMVKDERPLEVEEINISLRLKESKRDYIAPESPNLKKPKLVTYEMFISELERNQINNSLIDSTTNSSKYLDAYTKKRQVRTTTISNFKIILNSSNDLARFKEVMSKSPNAKITSSDFNSKNEDITQKKLTDELIKSARLKADKIAKLIDKKTTNLSNIKVITMQTKGHPKLLKLYTLEQKAYLELEVTFETENL